jgi:hypothetical protein
MGYYSINLGKPEIKKKYFYTKFLADNPKTLYLIKMLDK